MLTEAMERGARATVHQFAHYDPRANVLYLDTGQGRVLRLDGGEIREQDNGTDGVLFTLPPNSEPWTYRPDAPEDLVRSLLIGPVNFTDGEGTPHTAAEQRAFMLFWLLALAFEEVQPTKPLVLALGPAGAGKSSIFRRIGKMLFGQGFDVDGLRKDAEEDFYVATTNRPLVVFDNVDRAIPWLDDALAQSATGMRITKRKLYENNTALSYVPKAFIALTARTPRFRREDVADRMVIFQLDRLKEFTPEYDLLGQVLGQRDLLLSDYARMLNRVVAAPGVQHVGPSTRLADFVRVALRAGAGLGLGHVAEAAVGKLKQSQAIYATEENDLFILLDAWLSQRPEGHMDWGQGNEGRRVPTAQLYEELRELAEASGARWRFTNAVSLGKQLQALEEALGIHFRIERQRGGPTGVSPGSRARSRTQVNGRLPQKWAGNSRCRELSPKNLPHLQRKAESDMAGSRAPATLKADHLPHTCNGAVAGCCRLLQVVAGCCRLGSIYSARTDGRLQVFSAKSFLERFR